jgi:hypothetical protein
VATAAKGLCEDFRSIAKSVVGRLFALRLPSASGGKYDGFWEVGAFLQINGSIGSVADRGSNSPHAIEKASFHCAQ